MERYIKQKEKLAEYARGLIEPRKLAGRILDRQIEGRGAGRVVVDNGNTVFKIAVDPGVPQNRAEHKIWKKARGSKLAGHLAEVKSYANDYRWIEMQRVQNPISESAKFCDETAKSIRDRLNNHGIDIYELEYGYIDGCPVAYDYGILK